MTKYEVEWEELHIATIDADSEDEARKVVRRMAEMDESYLAILYGTLEVSEQ